MFPLLTNDVQGYWLLGLILLWAGLLFGGFLLGRPTTKNMQQIPLLCRMGSSLVLVVAGWSWFFFTQYSEAKDYSLFIAIGMTLGFVGDLAMAGLLPIKPPEIGGIGAFGLGHVAYIFALIQYGNRYGFAEALPRWGALAIWLVVGAVSWYFVIFRGQKATMLHWAALPYALLLSSTAGLATGLALQATDFLPLAVGTALFLASDLLIAAKLFSGLSFNLINDVIWLTYGPAQLLIVFSINTAWQVAHF